MYHIWRNTDDEILIEASHIVGAPITDESIKHIKHLAVPYPFLYALHMAYLNPGNFACFCV